MTTRATAIPAAPATPDGRYRFRHVAKMEWIKLRCLRSTWWTLAITATGATAMAIAIGLGTKNPSGDLTNNALAGAIPGLLLSGVLGVLMMTSEYSSGLIRATLAASPRRPLVLAAKAAVLGAVTLTAGEVTAFIAFFASGGALRGGIPAPTLVQPGVLQAVLLTGTSFALVGLIGLGLGTMIRHTAAAIAVLVGGVYLLGQFVAAAFHPLMAYLPISIVGNSLAVSRTPACPPGTASCPHFLSPWAGLGVLCLYAALALGLGCWQLTRRDA